MDDMDQAVEGYTPAATTIARLFVERSEHGLHGDPQFRVGDLAQQTGLSIEDTKDALDVELANFVEMSSRVGKMANRSVLVKESCFVEFDRHWTDWNPAKDALDLATDLVDDPEFPSRSAEIAERYDWEPRRLNPAISYLRGRGLIRNLRSVKARPYVLGTIACNDKTRRFVKGLI